MRKALVLNGLITMAGLFALSPALAWSPPAVGQTCHGMRGSGAAYVAIAGNFMGGRAAGAGMIDHKSFQACFRSEERCQHWLAMHQQRYPLGPIIASCQQVVLR